MTPAAKLLKECQAMLKPGDQLALRSDAWTYSKDGYVLLAVARPIGGCVLRIGAHEFDGLKVLQLAGFSSVTTDDPAPAAPQTIEQLKKERDALRAAKKR